MADAWTSTDSAVLQVLASILASQNRPDEAADLLEYVMARDPGSSDARRAAAAAYLLAGRYSETLDLIAAGTPPGRGDPLLLVKGQALWELGLTDEASLAVETYLGQGAAP
ncbi:MAG: tetratricopeptide repeat protein [Pseudomonadota bacterium]